MSTPDTPLVERLCRSLAFHVVEADNARALIAEAGFDIDLLYPLEDRPTLLPEG